MYLSEPGQGSCIAQLTCYLDPPKLCHVGRIICKLCVFVRCNTGGDANLPRPLMIAEITSFVRWCSTVEQETTRGINADHISDNTTWVVYNLCNWSFGIGLLSFLAIHEPNSDKSTLAMLQPLCIYSAHKSNRTLSCYRMRTFGCALSACRWKADNSAESLTDLALSNLVRCLFPINTWRSPVALKANTGHKW